MAEQINKSSKKLVFPENVQELFFAKIADASGLNWSELAEMADVNRRTLTNWKNGNHAPSYEPTKKLADKFEVPIPDKAETKGRFHTNKKAAKLGGQAKLEEYGSVCRNEQRRKKKWKEWWNKTGKFKNNLETTPTSIAKPEKSERLAEFVGVMLGDGGITEYQVRVTLNADDDKKYIDYVKSLLENLFAAPAKRCPRSKQKAVDIIVSRKALVKYCQRLGLPQGSKTKNGADIPNWIKQNKKYQKACIRGLFDTDGCIFNERHKINGKEYAYPRIHFVSTIAKLRNSIKLSLSSFGLNPRERNERAVTLEKRQDIVQFFSEIESHNPKLRRRYRKFMEK